MLPIKDNIPTERFPFVTVALIVANVVVYLRLFVTKRRPIMPPDPVY